MEEIFLITIVINSYNYSIAIDNMSKSIIKLDWALIMQMEHEKSFEIRFYLVAQIGPILLNIDNSLNRGSRVSHAHEDR